MKKNVKGQGLVEMALTLPLLLVVIVWAIGLLLVLVDMGVAYYSLSNASRAAANYVMDGRGSCHEKALAAFGTPGFFIAQTPVVPTITNCPSDATKAPAYDTQIVASVTLIENLVPFFYNVPFPVPIKHVDGYNR